MAPGPGSGPRPALPDEIVEEVLLRFPHDDPACLVRIALVCWRWWRLISATLFRRRFCDLHRTAPVMGALLNLSDSDAFFARFIPTSLSFPQRHADLRGWRMLDAHHGRALFHSLPWGLEPWDNELVVWDPVVGKRFTLPKLPWEPNPYERTWNAVVLCAATAAARDGGGCNHLDCRRGPFLVVFVLTGHEETFARVYSSEDNAWSEPTYAPRMDDYLELAPTVLVGNALYFMFHRTARVLKCDVATQEMTLIDLPPTTYPHHIVLTTTEDGDLGFAGADEFRLYLWSREYGPDGNVRWTQSRIIELNTLLPVDALSTSPDVLGFADGVDVIFIGADDGLYSIDLKSSQVRKVCTQYGFPDFVVPYTSFCAPGRVLLGL
ncbi:unnamed protein product [Urochloa decumbens]|uniref:F-box domain-containing protein n=1 Tax=Urochloa decumbens TaxID=240449 RepID=A0ABC8W001_9POAL